MNTLVKDLKKEADREGCAVDEGKYCPRAAAPGLCDKAAKEIDQLRDMLPSIVELKCMANLLMVSDPWPLMPRKKNKIEDYLNKMAKKHGFDNWTALYHDVIFTT